MQFVKICVGKNVLLEIFLAGLPIDACESCKKAKAKGGHCCGALALRQWK
jgi:hypothetical protein